VPGCGAHNSPPTSALVKEKTWIYIQDAAEITPTFQRGITNKWYEVAPKTFYFPNVDITKFCYFRFSKLYHPNGGCDGRYTFGAVLLEWPPLVGPRTEDDV
jgi:hypothetical protein